MKKVTLVILSIIVLLILAGCKEETTCDQNYSLVEGECVLDIIPYDETLYTSSEDVPLLFEREPSRFSL